MIKEVKTKLTLTAAGLTQEELIAAQALTMYRLAEPVQAGQFIKTAYSQKSDVFLVYCEDNILDYLEVAEDLMSSSPCVVAFVSDVVQEDVFLCCMNAGVSVFKKEDLCVALTFLYALGQRLKSWGNQAAKLQGKLDDVKLINRAKLLLMERFKMSEKEAHRYIEKTAMDNSMKRSEVAIAIIKTYEA